MPGKVSVMKDKTVSQAKQGKGSGLGKCVVKKKTQRKDPAWCAVGARCSLGRCKTPPCIPE